MWRHLLTPGFPSISCLMSREGQYCILENAGALCPWRQWCVIGGFRSLWLYIDSPFDSSCQIPLAEFTSWHLLHQVSMTFLFKGSHPISDCCIPLGSGGFNSFPIYWNLWAVPFLSQYVHGSIHSTMQTHFCELHVRYPTPRKIRNATLKEKKKKAIYSKNAFQLKCRLDFLAVVEKLTKLVSFSDFLFFRLMFQNLAIYIFKSLKIGTCHIPFLCIYANIASIVFCIWEASCKYLLI